MKISHLMLAALFLASCLHAQTDDSGVSPAAPPTVPPFSDERIFGVIPGYQFVETPALKLPPLTSRQKFVLFLKETGDPFTIFGAVMAASASQAFQDDPVYGEGAGAFGKRLGAAYADVATQNFFSDSLMAMVFREDPRYFRLGPKSGVLKRVGYSLSRVAVCRSDAGNDRICLSSLIGTTMAIGLSNAYYPRADRNGHEMLSREGYSFGSAAISNLLPEFWPDLKQRFFAGRTKKTKP